MLLTDQTFRKTIRNHTSQVTLTLTVQVAVSTLIAAVCRKPREIRKNICSPTIIDVQRTCPEHNFFRSNWYFSKSKQETQDVHCGICQVMLLSFIRILNNVRLKTVTSVSLKVRNYNFVDKTIPLVFGCLAERLFLLGISNFPKTYAAWSKTHHDKGLRRLIYSEMSRDKSSGGRRGKGGTNHHSRTY